MLKTETSVGQFNGEGLCELYQNKSENSIWCLAQNAFNYGLIASLNYLKHFSKPV